MNPPAAQGGGTVRISAAKRELPPGIRLRFCEMYMDELLNPQDLELVVRAYLDTKLAPKLVQFFLEMKRLADACEILDGGGNAPQVSLRTFVRAIMYGQTVQ